MPAKDTLSVDYFTIEYYGVDDVAGVEGVTRQWAPIEGGKVNLLTYLQMGAGEQQIRITYKGNAEYRPSASAETSVTAVSYTHLDVYKRQYIHFSKRIRLDRIDYIDGISFCF